jgi:hypothetical protein
MDAPGNFMVLNALDVGRTRAGGSLEQRIQGKI